jgi:hypothetical protein
MKYAPLDLNDDLARISLVPVPVEVLGDVAELHDQVAREIFGLDFPPFLPPEPEQGGFVATHDDSSVRAANEGAAVHRCLNLSCSYGHYFPPLYRVTSNQ